MKRIEHMRNDVIELSGATLRLPKRPHFANNGDLVSLQENEACLERDGEQHRLEGNCSSGRAALNTLVIDSPKVTRLHSIIHLEDNGAFWLVDLGSSNGTFLNKRRLHEPARLHGGDEINIGSNVFSFHQPRDKPSGGLKAGPLATLQEVENINCWLLVADIKNFTSLSRSMISGDLANKVGSWLGTCKDIIERYRGTINKYLGDGILVYWPDQPAATQDILSTNQRVKERSKL
jgi:adenylate cyclase